MSDVHMQPKKTKGFVFISVELKFPKYMWLNPCFFFFFLISLFFCHSRECDAILQAKTTRGFRLFFWILKQET